MNPTRATPADVRFIRATIADLETPESGLDKTDIACMTGLPALVIQDALTQLAGIIVTEFGTHSRGPVYRIRKDKEAA